MQIPHFPAISSMSKEQQQFIFGDVIPEAEIAWEVPIFKDDQTDELDLSSLSMSDDEFGD